MPRCVFVLLLLLPGSLTVEAQAPAAVAELSWMAGCWRQENGARVIDEVWMAPAGGLMLGTGRTVNNGRVVEFEFMHIREDAGRIVFTARPSGQQEASFTMSKGAPREVVFENLAHDFPQRVIYRRDGDTLTGRIEGTQNGKAASVDYPLRRVECPR
jgi:hypothetical protein